MSLKCEWTSTLGPAFFGVPQVLIGTHRGIPDVYLCVSRGESPNLLLPVSREAQEADCFRAAMVWNEYIALGFGEHVYIIDPQSRSLRLSIALGDYFGSFVHTPQQLLIASASKVRALVPSLQIVWCSRDVGIDGVLIESADENLIQGRGEWDPPGGWRPFRLDAHTGRLLRE